MNAAETIAALELPANSRVDRRVAKRDLVEKCVSTATDRRLINGGIEEVFWLAALKPNTIGVPEFRNSTREYLEIAVLSMVLRTDTHGKRLAELIHRAVPYPVFLIVSKGDAQTISLTHKRRSQGEAGSTVLDGDLVVANLGSGTDAAVGQPFMRALSVARQPRSDLFALYQGWMDAIVALLAAQVTGAFVLASSPELAASRRRALVECERINAQMVSLRVAAAKERQVSRQVELNLELRRLQTELSAARARL